MTNYHADHARSWRENLYVYPVISRRAGGLSVGVNLNPDKACNFDCIYCQVDRTVPGKVRTVELPRLRAELESMLRAAASGALFDDPHFAEVPASHWQVRDVAFSGDGEPTASPRFLEAVTLAADLRRRLGLEQLKIVVITDAAYLHKPAVRQALAVLDANHGEIWAKLDAGTEEYYRLINRPNVPLQTVLDNILEAARARPMVIQSLWMQVHGVPPPEAELAAFAARLNAITAAGGRIHLVQVYTVARQTAEPFVTPLDAATLTAIADRVRAATDLPVTAFS